MTAYQVMPSLTAEEYANLRDDIAANGVRVPVDVDENGQVLDGHHRALIAAELGIECPRRVLAGLSEDEKVAHAYAVNIQRRSLTREQKRALVAASLKRDPHLSDREHAKRTGVSHPTVADVRDELEQSGDVESSSTRVDAMGRQQPSTKQQPTRPAEWTCPDCGGAFKVEHTHCDTCGDHYPAPEVCTAHHDIVNTSTGEIVDSAPPPRRDPADKPGPLAVAADILARLTDLDARIARDFTTIVTGLNDADPAIRDGWLNDIERLADRLSDLHRELPARPTLRSVK